MPSDPHHREAIFSTGPSSGYRPGALADAYAEFTSSVLALRLTLFSLT